MYLPLCELPPKAPCGSSATSQKRMALKDDYPTWRTRVNARNRERWKTDPAFKLTMEQNRDRIKRNNRGLADQEISRQATGGCRICGEADFVCLSFHHLDPTTKRFDISRARSQGYSLKAITAELAKCVCLCENCHRKLHAGLFAL